MIPNQNFYGFRPSGQPCVETKEFNLVRNMLIAAVEERYRDAGMHFLHIWKGFDDASWVFAFDNIWIAQSFSFCFNY